MASYERGPSTPSELPIAPRVMRPDTFQSVGAALVDTLRGADVAFRNLFAQLAPLATIELAPDFERQVAPAMVALGDLGGDEASGTLDKIIAAVDGVVGDVEAQAGDLPDPDEPEPTIDTPPGSDFPPPTREDTGPGSGTPPTGTPPTGTPPTGTPPTGTPPTEPPAEPPSEPPVEPPSGGGGGGDRGGGDRPGRGGGV